MSQILHATLVAHRIDGRWRGALVRGASGAGKSSMAVRCMAAGFRLVADDRVTVFTSGGRVFGKAPAPLAGLIEIRGVGVVTAASAPSPCEIALVVELASAAERMPESVFSTVAGLPLPRLIFTFTDADLPLRLAAALAAVQRGL